MRRLYNTIDIDIKHGKLGIRERGKVRNLERKWMGGGMRGNCRLVEMVWMRLDMLWLWFVNRLS